MSRVARIGSTQLCTFLVDQYLFGIDLRRVQEVIRHQPMTPIPLAPAVVRGLINLRGQIVTALDLRRRLGLREQPAHTMPMNVVVRREDAIVSLLVDDIDDVVELDDSVLEPPPETLSASARTLVRGVYKLNSKLLLLLDTDAAVRFDTQTTTEGTHHG